MGLPLDGGGRCPAPALTAAPASQVLPTDELAEPKKSHRQSHRKKVLPEIYLTRLLSTKVGGPPRATEAAAHPPGGRDSPSGGSGAPRVRG